MIKLMQEKSLNIIKKEIDFHFSSKKQAIQDRELNTKLINEKIDISLPPRPIKKR